MCVALSISLLAGMSDEPPFMLMPALSSLHDAKILGLHVRLDDVKSTLDERIVKLEKSSRQLLLKLEDIKSTVSGNTTKLEKMNEQLGAVLLLLKQGGVRPRL
jgi:hypothetical protein